MIGLVTELLLCVLLATSIGYSILLDRRLRLMKADEQTMRKTIVDLVSATEKAERAVAGLRNLINDCDQSIAGHLREAERHTHDLAEQIRTGDDVIARIARIVETARGAAPASPLRDASALREQGSARRSAPVPEPEPTPQERLAATLAAAQAFAERARRRVDGQAA